MTAPVSAQTDTTSTDPEVQKTNAETARMAAETAKIVAQQAQEAAKQNLANTQDPALQEAARQKALADAAKSAADLRKSAAESDKAATDARKAAVADSLPTFTSKPIEGNVTVDAASGYFAQLLAYDALRSLADDIVGELLATGALTDDSKVYLATSGDQLQATGQRLVISGKLNAYKYAFKLLDEAVKRENQTRLSFHEESLAALDALPALVGVAADVAAFFRQERGIYGKTVTVPPALMAQTVAGAWLRRAHVKSADGKSTMPTVEFVDPTAIIKLPETQRDAALINVLAGLEMSSIKLSSDREIISKQLENDKLALASQKTSLADLEKTTGEKPTPKQQDQIAIADSKIRTATNLLDRLTVILTGYRSFADSLLAVASGESQSALAKVFYNDVLNSDPATKVYLLQVQVASVGGEMETRKWLWSSGKVYHRAGAVCVYTLFDRSGRIAAAGMVAADRQAKEGMAVGNFIKK
jgi:hypothetical protein